MGIGSDGNFNQSGHFQFPVIIDNAGDLFMAHQEQLLLLFFMIKTPAFNQSTDQRRAPTQMVAGPGKQKTDLQIENVLVTEALGPRLKGTTLQIELVVTVIRQNLGLDIDGKKLFDNKLSLCIG